MACQRSDMPRFVWSGDRETHHLTRLAFEAASLRIVAVTASVTGTTVSASTSTNPPTLRSDN